MWYHGDMAKGRRTKLTRKIIEATEHYVKHRLTQKEIAVLLGIDPKTFRNWRERGLEAESGIYREFVDAIDRAEAEFSLEVVGVIRKAIMGGEKQIIRKVIVENGIPVKTEITEKTLLPDAKLGLEVMARTQPEIWGRYDTLHIETDLRSEAESMGLDVEEIIGALAQTIERLMAGEEITDVSEMVALVEPQSNSEAHHHDDSDRVTSEEDTQ